MITRRWKKAVCVIISILAIFCLFGMNQPKAAKSAEAERYITYPVPHVPMPRNFRGKVLPFHQIYEPRQVVFPADLQNKVISDKKTKTILLWTPWNGVRNTINYYSLQIGNRSFVKYNCPNAKCIATRNRKNLNKSDVVLFHLLDTKPSDLPDFRTSEQLWILYNLEPPWLIKRKVYQLQNLSSLFNWTMSYRSDSNVVAKYGFIVPSESRNSTLFYNKTRNVVWFVSDCITGSKREEYVKELSNYIDVDIFGRCGNHKCFPAQSDVCYQKVLQKYKFYLSFENAICKDYVTEKFFNVFNYDIVPVVFGAASYSSIAPEGTFIDATQYPRPRELAATLHTISKDENLYKNFLLKKQSFKSYLDPWMCRLCNNLHTSEKHTHMEDVEKWWLTQSQCRTWNKSGQLFEAVA